MRQIKFRAWHNGKMLYHHPAMSVHDFSIMPDGKVFYRDEPGYVHGKNRDSVIMQWTGLTDKNGTDIYEGDALKSYEVSLASPDKVMFVKVSGCTFVIYNPNCCDICRNGYGCIGPLDEWPDNTYEVIGNMYQNPNLLLEKEPINGLR